jgi:hypothetical protein
VCCCTALCILLFCSMWSCRTFSCTKAVGHLVWLWYDGCGLRCLGRARKAYDLVAAVWCCCNDTPKGDASMPRFRPIDPVTLQLYCTVYSSMLFTKWSCRTCSCTKAVGHLVWLWADGCGLRCPLTGQGSRHTTSSQVCAAAIHCAVYFFAYHVELRKGRSSRFCVVW